MKKILPPPPPPVEGRNLGKGGRGGMRNGGYGNSRILKTPIKIGHLLSSLSHTHTHTFIYMCKCVKSVCLSVRPSGILLAETQCQGYPSVSWVSLGVRFVCEETRVPQCDG
jgi:hypothetical protein